MCEFRIEELSLFNYRRFENKKFTLNSRMNVFVGKNGSGKTMLLRAISGLINLDSGSIFIDGEKLHDKIEFPPETGIVIENMELLPECSAKRNLQMLAKIKNIADEKDIIFSLERVGLDPDSDKKVKKFSLGMKQRLNIAQAIFENQKIILLDEPTNALDEDAVQLIYKIIREVKSRGAKVILVCTDACARELKDGVADYVIEIPHTDELLMPITAVVPLQILAYYTSINRGIDPDKPKNLAKSVTVE